MLLRGQTEDYWHNAASSSSPLRKNSCNEVFVVDYNDKFSSKYSHNYLYFKVNGAYKLLLKSNISKLNECCFTFDDINTGSFF